MKSNMKILAILLCLILSSVIFPKQSSAQEVNVSFQVFYDQLSPYGQWLNYPNYGYVWIPDAGADFVPYSTEGHWIYTDYGWTWVSDYNWGWAPFHYGRWGYDNSYGWFWAPDYEWGPSWVTWRRSEGYYGWEPMEPGISISASFGSGYNNHNDHWMFVRDRDIDRSDVNHYYINRSDHDRIIRNSSVINKTYVDNSRHTTYVAGPAKDDVQKVTGRRVNAVNVQDNDKPGQSVNNGKLKIYRPLVKANNDNGHKPVPSKVATMNEVKRPPERNATSQPRNVNSQDNNRPVRQPNNANPQNDNNNKAKPIQQQITKPTGNNKPEQHQNNVKQQNNNNNTKPLQPQMSKPSENNRPERQPNNTNPQNNNNSKPQPAQPQMQKPSDNNRPEQHQNNASPQNNSNTKSQPSQPQPQRTNPPNNNRPEQHENNVKQQNNSGNEQPKESKPDPEKR